MCYLVKEELQKSLLCSQETMYYFTHCCHYLEALKSAVFFETNDLIQYIALLCQQKLIPSSETATQITQRLDHQPQFQFCY